MILAGRRAVCGVCFLGGGDAAKADATTVHRDFGPPLQFFNAPIYALQAVSAVAMTFGVARTFTVICLTQIAEAVVIANGVYVIDLVDRPTTMHIQPCQTSGAVWSPVNSDPAVAVVIRVPATAPRLARLR